MSELLKKISSPDFVPEKYVKDISQVCIGGLELQKHKAAVTALSEQTNVALKKNVYKNYMQFIETAREISHLEGEMYQLSHLLTEQRALLAGMGNAPLAQQSNEQEAKQQSVAQEKEAKEEKRLSALTQISDKVEGCIVLTEVPGRELLYEGDLVELDLLENTAVHRCHAFLLSDILIITTWISNRRGAGSAKYKYEAVYELGSLAVVNVRDFGQVKHAFKLLVFPDTRLFQCANHQAKEAWLSKLDETKRAKMNPEKKSSDAVQKSSLNEHSSPVRAESIDSGNNPFLSYSEWSGKESPDGGSMTPEWVCDSPEDLDVLIAQRHFEQAFALVQKTNSFLNKAPNTSTNLDIKTKVEARIKSLIEVLLKELSVSNEKSMQGGLRASRRAVKLLNQLGKSNQACELYLKLCTSVLKSQMKRVKRECATTAYIKQLSTAFFSNLAFITNEFQFRAFPNTPSCSSGYVVWASSEVSHFTANAIKQIFMHQTSLEIIAECIETIRKQCRQLTEVGLDMEYQVDGQLSIPVSRALNEVGDKLVDAVKLRASEDQWKPSHHSKPAFHKLQQDFTACNLPPIKNYMTGDGWLDLTQNTINFFRLYLGLLTDGLKLANRDLEYSLSNILYQVFDAHLKHVALSIKSEKHKSQRVLIHKNAVFLIDHLLKRSNEKYSNAMGHSCKKLDQLQEKYSSYIKDNTVISNVTGYL